MTYTIKQNVLIYGYTTFEHALVQKLVESKFVENIYAANCDDDIKKYVTEFFLEDGFSLIKKAKERNVDLLIANFDGNDNGIIDAFEKAGIVCIGCKKYWTQLESSKSFAKKFMERNNIPTAPYVFFEDENEAKEYLDNIEFPIVVKADGYSRGAGVFICKNKNEAYDAVDKILNKRITTACSKLLIEKYISGIEVTLMSLWDGKTLLPLLPCKDYKKFYDNDEGPNTASMGCYVPFELSAEQKKLIEQYLKNFEIALKKENVNIKACIYSGLIINENGLYVLEYNMRFGEPEGAAVLMHLKNDIVDVFSAMSQSKLSEINLFWHENITACINLVGNNYLVGGDNLEIKKSQLEILKNKKIRSFFFKINDKQDYYHTNSGLLATLSYTGKNPFSYIYDNIQELRLENVRYRKDIGQ